MRGDIDTIKERLDITEVLSNYLKLEKAGTNFKARCPFHNEKTPSFFVSSARQSYYCFGCGAKGDIFSFIEAMEGLDFKGSLKFLAEKAGVELEYSPDSKPEKEEALKAVESATKFFESELDKNDEAKKYLLSRGLSTETIKSWRIGFAPNEWRALRAHLISLGFKEEVLLRAGLIKKPEESGKESYDVFRSRIIFPIFDTSGRVIAFSGRLLGEEVGPKYLNSPDSIIFNKSEVLYGLDRAKEGIRRKNYTVLVEGQLDLLLSHQAGVSNTVASSGTAFTDRHLERLKRFSPRIILAFDGDEAGEKAAEKSSLLALSLGLEVKVAKLPEGKDPADLASLDSELWKNVLRESLPAIEYFLDRTLELERDKRKAGKEVEKRILPMVSLLGSAIEQSHFVSLITKRTGIKEEALWQDLRKNLISAESENSRALPTSGLRRDENLSDSASKRTYKEKIEERLKEVKLWKKELTSGTAEWALLGREEEELEANLSAEEVRDELNQTLAQLREAERKGESESVAKLLQEVKRLHEKVHSLEEKKKKL